MKAIVGLLVATVLAVGSGCAKTDWIDRTLDVTGTSTGTPDGPPIGNLGPIFLDLKQEGSTVHRFLQQNGGTPSPPGPVGGPISGTGAGDVFRFKGNRGIIAGELTVNGEEMKGTLQIAGTHRLTLLRVDPSSPPGSPPR